MLLFHTTPAQNSRKIAKYGVLTAFARTKERVIWLHTIQLEEWAARHVGRRHVCANGRVDHILVDIPRKWLRHRSRGVWTVARNIPPRCLVGSKAHAQWERDRRFRALLTRAFQS